jgi:hypothetical protein
MNDLLTPLAFLGIVVFAIAVVLVAVLYVRQAVGVVRLLRTGRMNVRLTWGSKPLESPAPWLEPEEAAAPSESIEPRSDAPGGWGFDRR